MSALVGYKFGRVVIQREPITQVAVANFVDGYIRHLPDFRVEIKTASFIDVPLSVLKNPGLPKEDLLTSSTYSRFKLPSIFSSN